MPSADPFVFLLGALLLLTVPLYWLAAAVLAAAFHELCHWTAIRLLGGRVFSLSIGSGGAVIHSQLDGWGREAAAALAGPMGSFLLLAFFRVFPELSVCGLFQGAYNLLPVYPLDGGRILRCFLMRYCPSAQDSIEKFLFWVLAAAGLAGTFLYRLGVLPLLIAVRLAFLRKRPCKESKIGVQ